VARGFLEIETDGDYRFSTSSSDDRNTLLINDKVVCAFGDGDLTVATISLKKGRVRIVSAGFVGGRGGSGIQVRWQPPGQTELSAIPAHLLKHPDDATLPAKTTQLKAPPAPDLLAKHLITVTDDFVAEAYKNGVRIPDAKRKLLEENYGATAERIHADIRPGDWLVFHVVNNRLRRGEVKFFAMAGCRDKNKFGFASDPASKDWSVCDDPARAHDFIGNRDEGTGNRAAAISNPWLDGTLSLLVPSSYVPSSYGESRQIVCPFGAAYGESRQIVCPFGAAFELVSLRATCPNYPFELSLRIALPTTPSAAPLAPDSFGGSPSGGIGSQPDPFVN
jgi:hypothetical protein